MVLAVTLLCTACAPAAPAPKIPAGNKAVAQLGIWSRKDDRLSRKNCGTGVPPAKLLISLKANGAAEANRPFTELTSTLLCVASC